MSGPGHLHRATSGRLILQSDKLRSCGCCGSSGGNPADLCCGITPFGPLGEVAALLVVPHRATVIYSSTKRIRETELPSGIVTRDETEEWSLPSYTYNVNKTMGCNTLHVENTSITSSLGNGAAVQIRTFITLINFSFPQQFIQGDVTIGNFEGLTYVRQFRSGVQQINASTTSFNPANVVPTVTTTITQTLGGWPTGALVQSSWNIYNIRNDPFERVEVWNTGSLSIDFKIGNSGLGICSPTDMGL